jgi:hypothetical protein
MSSYIFIVASDATPTLLWDYAGCYENSMRPYKVFLAASLPTLIAASCRLYLRHYCRLDSSSHRTTCGITARLSDLYTAHHWAVATSMLTFSVILLSMSSSHIILIIDEQLQLPCRLLALYCSWLAVLELYCSSLCSCDFHVVFYYYTALDEQLSYYTVHHWAVATSMLSYIFIVASDATPTLLWDYCRLDWSL